jgi:hypothetical protein
MMAREIEKARDGLRRDERIRTGIVIEEGRERVRKCQKD